MKSFTLLLGVIFLAGCDPCRGNRACADTFDFKLIDNINGDDLVFGTNPTYNKDSVYLFTKLQGYSGKMSYPKENKFSSTLLLPVDTFFLHLGSTDTDTLVMFYDFRKVKCCSTNEGFGKLKFIKFNGVNTILENNIHVLRK
ncbi:MAG TPA: hypothetical protein V6C58_26855 [Allocoleopsis sp.]